AALPLVALLVLTDWLAGGFDNWVLIALMSFPECFMNGTVMATLAVLSPQLLRTYDENSYFHPP
ncbi:MAG: hypothetical protein ACK5HY_05975, partial [Parahaliea sp.]